MTTGRIARCVRLNSDVRKMLREVNDKTGLRLSATKLANGLVRMAFKDHYQKPSTPNQTYAKE